MPKYDFDKHYPKFPEKITREKRTYYSTPKGLFPTLQEAGDAEGVTRERIRQKVNSARHQEYFTLQRRKFPNENQPLVAALKKYANKLTEDAFYRKWYNERRNLKRCADCGYYLPVEKFGVYRRETDGLNTRCKDCMNNRAKSYIARLKAEAA